MQHTKGPEPHRLVNQLFCVVSFESSLRAAEADRMDKLPEADLDLVRVASGKRKVTELLWTSGPLHDAGVRQRSGSSGRLSLEPHRAPSEILPAFRHQTLNATDFSPSFMQIAVCALHIVNLHLVVLSLQETNVYC